MFSTLSAYAYLFIAMLSITKEVHSDDRPIKVVTSVGDFVGTIKSVGFGGETRGVRQFLGIPYAKPPIGSLRFAPSVMADKVTYQYNATYYRPHCPQREDVNKLLR